MVSVEPKSWSWSWSCHCSCCGPCSCRVCGLVPGPAPVFGCVHVPSRDSGSGVGPDHCGVLGPGAGPHPVPGPACWTAPRCSSGSDPLVCPRFSFNPPKVKLKFRLGFPFGPRPAGIHCLQYSNPEFGAMTMPPLLKRPRCRHKMELELCPAAFSRVPTVYSHFLSFFSASVSVLRYHSAWLESAPSGGQVAILPIKCGRASSVRSTGLVLVSCDLDESEPSLTFSSNANICWHHWVTEWAGLNNVSHNQQSGLSVWCERVSARHSSECAAQSPVSGLRSISSVDGPSLLLLCRAMQLKAQAQC